MGKVAPIVLISVGVLFVGAAFAAWFGTEAAIRSLIISNLVVTSKDSKGFGAFSDTDDKDVPALYWVWYLWNMTNPDEIVQGGRPAFTSQGPFTYRYNEQKIDIEFFDGGDKVKFRPFSHFDFVLEKSESDHKTTFNTNLNRAYMLMVQRAGNEENLSKGVTTGLISSFVANLTSTSTSKMLQMGAYSAASPSILPGIKAGVTAGANLTDDQFLGIWANSLSAPSPLWPENFLVSNYSNSSIGMSPASAAALWNPAFNFSLVRNDPSSFSFWAAASADPATANQLFGILSAPPFSLTTVQSTAVLAWFSTYKMVNIKPKVDAQIGCPGCNDSTLGYLQWARGSLTNGLSIKYLIPSTPPIPVIPEFGIWASSVGINITSLTADAARVLFEGPLGLAVDPLTNTGAFFGNYAAMMQGQLPEAQFTAMFGLSKIEAVAFAGNFFTNPPTQGFHGYFQTGMTDPIITQQLPAQGGGFIRTRSVSDIVTGYYDPLLNIVLGDESPWLRYSPDYRDEADCQANEFQDSYYTGGGTLNDMMDKITYNYSEIMNQYAVPQDVKGRYQPHSPPFQLLTETPKFYFFLNIITRARIFEYDHDSTLFGDIPTKKYVGWSHEFDINPDTPSMLECFMNNSMNFMGFPLYVSNPHMYGCPDEYPSKIDGMQPDPDRDYIRLWMEPNTGRGVQARNAVQLNFFMDATWSQKLNRYNVNTTSNVMYPQIYRLDGAEANENGKKILRNVLRLRGFQLGGTIAFALMAVILLVAGSVLLVLAIKKSKT